MLNRLMRLCLIVLTVMLASGCASVQMASPEQDSQAKTFSVAPDKANIYVYRNEVY